MPRKNGFQGVQPLVAGEVLVIGRKFIVKRFNGTEDEEVPALLIETKQVCNRELRQNRDEKRTKNLHNPASAQEVIPEDDDSANEDMAPESTSPSKRMFNLFYIHYVGTDRRLDEWVERERFIGYAPVDTSNNGSIESTNQQGTLTRSQRRFHEEYLHVQPSFDDMDAYTAKLEKEHEEATKIKNVLSIRIGEQQMATWYFSPFPHGTQEILYFCEFCLAYTPVKEHWFHHMLHCKRRAPPGEEIYRKDNIVVHEVSGLEEKLYCQCLCLLSKLFMDHKTLYYDVSGFLFYIICVVDKDGTHIVGHFSKERESLNNLACIMILPPYQRSGFGKLLIQLTEREGWIGTPERPLSDLGKVSYRSYWWWRIKTALRSMIAENIEDTNSHELAVRAGVLEKDIVSTLSSTGGIKPRKDGGPVRLNKRCIDHLSSLETGRKPPMLLDKSCLTWTPSRPRLSDD